MNKKYTLMNPSIIIIVLIVIAGLWSLWSVLVVRNVEQPKYTVMEVYDDYEIRDYPPFIVAEVEVQGARNEALNQWFRLLADYIFWNNTKSTPIAMTAPVVENPSEAVAMTAPVMEQGTGEMRKVTFTMPSSYTLETLPKPNNNRVTLREVPAHRVAVKRFRFWATDARVARMQKDLVSALQRDGIKTIGVPSYAWYNPPFSAPWIQRQEVMIQIQK